MDEQRIEEVLCDISLDALSQEHKDVYFNILSNGMRYVLTTRDKILVRKVEPASIRPGQLIVYKRPDNNYTVHRVMCTYRDGGQVVFIAKPDAYPAIDPPVEADRVIGVVIAIRKPRFYIRLDTFSGRCVECALYHFSKPSFRPRAMVLKYYRLVLRACAVFTRGRT